MRVLDEGLIAKILKNDISTSTVLSFSKMCVGNIDSDGRVAPNILVVDASHNYLKSIGALWSTLCPSAWWINASFNHIMNLSFETMPSALGSLNLADNELPPQNLDALRSIHILRLRVIGCNKTSGISSSDINNAATSHRSRTIHLLPNIWVLDDDFITYSERNFPRETSTPVENNNLSSEISCDSVTTIQSWSTNAQRTSGFNISLDWRTRIASDKEQSLLRLIQRVPLDALIGDYCRLDVLLEDYLEEMRITNIYNRSTLTDNKHSKNNSNSNGCNTCSQSNYSNINMLQLLSLPHKIRLDLSVLLTASILLTVPTQLYKDSIILLLSPYLPYDDIICYIALPSFICTALVSIIRRICKKEIKELNCLFLLLPKPTTKEFPNHNQEKLGSQEHSFKNINMTNNIDYDDFYHLKPLQFYLNTSIPERYNVKQNMFHKDLNNDLNKKLKDKLNKNLPTEFSLSELEILTILPDIPTKYLYPVTKDSKSYECLQFLAEKTFSLIKQTNGFPTLKNNQNNQKNQNLFNELLPTLKLGNIKYKEFQFTQSFINDEKNEIRYDITKFGIGFPNGKISELSWKKNNIKNKLNRVTKANTILNRKLANIKCNDEINEKVNDNVNEIFNNQLLMDIKHEVKFFRTNFNERNSTQIVNIQKLNMKSYEEFKNSASYDFDNNDKNMIRNMESNMVKEKLKKNSSLNSIVETSDNNISDSNNDNKISDSNNDDDIRDSNNDNNNNNNKNSNNDNTNNNNNNSDNNNNNDSDNDHNGNDNNDNSNNNDHNNNDNDIDENNNNDNDNINQNNNDHNCDNYNYIDDNDNHDNINNSNDNSDYNNCNDNNHDNDDNNYNYSNNDHDKNNKDSYDNDYDINEEIRPQQRQHQNESQQHPETKDNISISTSLPNTVSFSSSFKVTSSSLKVTSSSSSSKLNNLYSLHATNTNQFLKITNNEIKKSNNIEKNSDQSNDKSSYDNKAKNNNVAHTEENLEDAQWRLLKEMGTIRNMRYLNDSFSQKLSAGKMAKNEHSWYAISPIKRNISPPSFNRHDNRHIAEDNGHNTEDKGHSTQDSGHNTHDNRHIAEDNGHNTEDSGHNTQDSGHNTHDSRHIAEDNGHSTHDNRHNTHDNRHIAEDNGHNTHDNRHNTHDNRHIAEDNGHTAHDKGHSTQDSGHNTHDNRHNAQDTGHNISTQGFRNPFRDLREFEKNQLIPVSSHGRPNAMGMRTGQTSTNSTYREKIISLQPYEFHMKENPFSCLDRNYLESTMRVGSQNHGRPFSSGSGIDSSSPIGSNHENKRNYRFKPKKTKSSSHNNNNKGNKNDSKNYGDDSDNKKDISTMLRDLILSEDNSDNNRKKFFRKSATYKIQFSKSDSFTKFDSSDHNNDNFNDNNNHNYVNDNNRKNNKNNDDKYDTHNNDNNSHNNNSNNHNNSSNNNHNYSSNKNSNSTNDNNNDNNNNNNNDITDNNYNNNNNSTNDNNDNNNSNSNIHCRPLIDNRSKRNYKEEIHFRHVTDTFKLRTSFYHLKI